MVFQVTKPQGCEPTQCSLAHYLDPCPGSVHPLNTGLRTRASPGADACRRERVASIALHCCTCTIQGTPFSGCKQGMTTWSLVVKYHAETERVSGVGGGRRYDPSSTECRECFEFWIVERQGIGSAESKRPEKKTRVPHRGLSTCHSRNRVRLARFS